MSGSADSPFASCAARAIFESASPSTYSMTRYVTSCCLARRSMICVTFGCSIARRDASLVDEHRLEGRVLGVLREDGLDGDELLESVLARLPGDPHARHPTFGDGAEQLVPVEPVTRRDGRAPWGRNAHGAIIARPRGERASVRGRVARHQLLSSRSRTTRGNCCTTSRSRRPEWCRPASGCCT